MLVKFDKLATIPSFATVTSAQLRIFGPPYSAGGCCPNSQPSGGNPITAGWDESTVTWGSIFGATTPTGAISVPNSGSVWGWNPAFNVTAMVQGFVSGTFANNGFMFQLQDETGERKAAFFASSEHATASLRPQLIVCYTVDCETDFKYTFSSMPNQNEYTFEVINPTAGYSYEWLVGGTLVATGTSITITLPADLSNEVMLRGRNSAGIIRCEKQIDICNYGKASNLLPPTAGNCYGDAAFTVSMNTVNPYEVKIAAVNPSLLYAYNWSLAGPYTGTASRTSFTVNYPAGSTVHPNAGLSLGGAGCATATKYCFSPSGDLSERPAESSVAQIDYVIPPDAIYDEVISVYPNPSNGGWNLQVNSELKDDVLEIELSDITGKVIYKQSESL